MLLSRHDTILIPKTKDLKVLRSFVVMLEIEVELPQETKTIEWNKAHPTFHELKERLHQYGIATRKNYCVEVDRAGEFVTLDDDDLVDGPLIRVRASQILCKTSWKRPKPNQPPMKGDVSSVILSCS